MKISTYQLGDLRKVDPTLYSYILPVAKGVDGDVVEIDTSKLVPLQRKLLGSWAAANGIRDFDSAQHDVKTCGCNSCFEKRTAEELEKQKPGLVLQEKAKAAVARLRQYMTDQVPSTPGRLLDNQHNRNAWDEFRAKLPADAVYSPALIDSFIAGWQNVLQWEKIPVAPPTPEVPLVPTLASGEPELPLDASESEMRRASKEQLRSLSKRRGEVVSQPTAFVFQPMPPEITRKILVNCTRDELKKYRETYGSSSIDSRLQGRG